MSKSLRIGAVVVLMLVMGLGIAFSAQIKVGWEATPRYSAKELYQNQPKSSSGLMDVDLDLAHWSTLRNKYGWKIKYPKNWVADSAGDVTAETSGIVDFSGPWDCAKERCVVLQIDSEILRDEFKDSLERYLDVDKLRPYLISQRKFEVSDFPALEVDFRCSAALGAIEVPCRQIAIKHNGRILRISYSEQGSDRNTIKSPSDWKYIAIFDKMLTTLAVYQVPERVWEKPR